MTVSQHARGELFLGSYEAIRLLDEGGMGQVFLGRHLPSGREVVIKVMRDHLATMPRLRAAFQREMQVMMRFRHPYAVALLDAALEGPGRPCLILEYVVGPTLEELLGAEGRLEPRRAGRLLNQLCQVLHAAHGGGILHRDLSATNIMVMPTDWGDAAGGHGEQIKVLDFGLARVGRGFFVPMEKLTGSGTSIGGGTPAYMCPEQVRGEAVDQRGDLYSVGVILYKMLTGVLPFGPATDITEMLRAHIEKQPRRFAELGVHDIAPAVEAVVQDCLAKYPRERPQSARELAKKLSLALGDSLFQAEDFPATDGLSNHQGRPGCVELDRFEAWMPEPIAILKLRSFIDALQGEVIASEPGYLRVRLLDPRVPRQTCSARAGLVSFFGLGRKTLSAPPTLLIELLMRKKQSGLRSLVEITLTLPVDPSAPTAPSEEEQTMRLGFGARISRELRAYLMVGS
jgi:serine/threonine protein kinase